MSRKKLFFEVIIEHFRKIHIPKRQRFIFGVLFLSVGLFYSEHLFGRSGVYLVLFLSLLADVFFAVALYKDLKENFSPYMFILPFFYTIAFGLFYFLIPARFLTRIGWAFLYAVGLYSLYLSLNIFVVASIRTIALVSGARIVSFVITFLSFGLFTKVLFSLEWPLATAIFLKPLLLFVFSFLLITQSLWTMTLEVGFSRRVLLWAAFLALALSEMALVLLFWPSTSTFIAIFLTGMFYTIVGLSHAWFDRRLFKGVIWEYVWVGAIVLFMLLSFTSWRG